MLEGSFQVSTRKSQGNLHVRLEGIFDGNSALTLTHLLQDRRQDCGRLFIDTERLHRVDPLGTTVLHTFLRKDAQLTQRVYFKGKNGLALALDGQRVLRSKPGHKCGCSGKCRVCKCAGRREKQKAMQAEQQECGTLE